MRHLIRRARHLAAAIALAAGAAGAAAEPVRYELDPEHLSIGFLVDHIGYAKVLGMFREASGEFTYDETTGAVTAMRVVVETGSVFSNHEKRDGHLRSADFLNSAEYPRMVFTAAAARSTGEGRYTIEGELELLGSRHPLTLEATLNRSAEYPIGGGLLGGKPWVVGVSARGSFEREPYGMTYALDNGWVGNTVELIIELEARRAD